MTEDKNKTNRSRQENEVREYIELIVGLSELERARVSGYVDGLRSSRQKTA